MINITELAVNRSEAHIGHLIKVIKLLHDHLADNRRRDFAVITLLQLPLDQDPIVAERLGSLLNANPVDIETKIDSADG